MADGEDSDRLGPSPPSSFPQNPEEFDADPRVSFSKLSNKFILETDDGQEFEYEDALRRWIPVLDDALLEQQRQAYAVQGVDESEPVLAGRKAKRKKGGEDDEYVNGRDEVGGRAISKKAKPAHEPRERKNTAVYVTNLPIDPPATLDEIQHVFSRCGVIAEEIDHGRPRVKLYTNEDGSFKGDALIVYFRPESVDLAIQMLDDSELRLGGGKGNMRVAAADFSYKRVKDEGDGSAAKKGGGAGDKKKIIKKTQKLNSKLADWSDDDDPSALRETSSRWDKVVILKHMFTLQELDEDPAAVLDIKEDIRDECGKVGDVTNVVLFDKETEGVASVRFSNAEAANACVRVMNGRHFSGQIIQASIANGDEKFRKSDPRGGSGGLGKKGAPAPGLAGSDDEEDEEERLDDFGAWLEREGCILRRKN